MASKNRHLFCSPVYELAGWVLVLCPRFSWSQMCLLMHLHLAGRWAGLRGSWVGGLSLLHLATRLLLAAWGVWGKTEVHKAQCQNLHIVPFSVFYWPKQVTSSAQTPWVGKIKSTSLIGAQRHTAKNKERGRGGEFWNNFCSPSTGGWMDSLAEAMHGID